MLLFKIITPSDRTDTKTEVTRWVVKGQLSANTWDELIARLQRLFNTRSTKFFVSWFDGTDYCTVRDSSDLQEAVDFFDASETNEKAVRIYASPDKREHHTIFGAKPMQDEPFKSDEPSIQEESEVEFGQEAVKGSAETEDEQLAAALAATISDMRKSEQETIEADEGAAKPAITPIALPTPAAETTETGVTAAAAATAVAAAAAAPVPAPASVSPPVTPYGQGPMNTYMQYVNPYPYGQYYPLMPPGQIYPVGIPAAPVPADLTPRMSISSGFGATAPPLSDSRATIINLGGSTCPDTEMLAAISRITQEPPESVPAETQPTRKAPKPPRPATPAGGEGERHKKKSSYIAMSIQTLRSMGYDQDERELKRIIKQCKGNLNAIIDKLQQSGI